MVASAGWRWLRLHVDVAEQIRGDAARIAQRVPCTRCFFKLLKKLAVGALSQRLMSRTAQISPVV